MKRSFNGAKNSDKNKRLFILRNRFTFRRTIIDVFSLVTKSRNKLVPARNNRLKREHYWLESSFESKSDSEVNSYKVLVFLNL